MNAPTSAPERLGADPRYAFLERQLTRLGDRDPLAAMAAAPDALAAIVAQHSAATLQQRPFADKWTPCEILAHLVDTEWIMGFRMRTILADESPVLAGIDPDRWVVAQQANQTAPTAHLATFRALRTSNLTFWQQLSADHLDRAGLHSEAGIPYSLRLLRRIIAGHDLVHRDQMNRYLEAIADGEA